MFGLALRSYQKKVRRLTESVTDTQQTLWAAVLDFIGQEGGTVQRKRVLERYRYDGEEQVAAVLNDLVSSGLVYRTGRGLNCIYGLTDEKDYASMVERDRDEALPWLVWVVAYRSGGMTRQEIRDAIPFEDDAIDTALGELLADGRAESVFVDGQEKIRASTFLVPVGSQAGWEAAIFDHFQAMCNAISSKLRGGEVGSNVDDQVGGATLSFDVYPGHPFENEVHGLLKRVRQDVNVLWRAVSEYNKSHPPPAETKRKVSFYFGQYVEGADEPDEMED